MAYIRFDITEEQANEGKRTNATIARLRSDIDGVSTNELNIIFHALALAESLREVLSCFGAGYWRGDKAWLGNDTWKG